jgi:hypothetical protein
MAATEDRAERFARNQSLFRDINNRLDELHRAHDETLPRDEFLCECASDVCVDHITLTLFEYRQLRENPVAFAVSPSGAHVYPEVERIVARTPGYWIVEKQGSAAAIARAEARQDGGEPDRRTAAEDRDLRQDTRESRFDRL